MDAKGLPSSYYPGLLILQPYPWEVSVEVHPFCVSSLLLLSQYPFEALFRSQHYALLDNSCREYLFICEFFVVSGPAAHDLFHAVMGRTLSMTLVRFLFPVLFNTFVPSLHQQHSGVMTLVELKSGSPHSKMSKPWLGTVAHTHNPSILGVRGSRIA